MVQQIRAYQSAGVPDATSAAEIRGDLLLQSRIIGLPIRASGSGTATWMSDNGVSSRLPAPCAPTILMVVRRLQAKTSLGGEIGQTAHDLVHTTSHPLCVDFLSSRCMDTRHPWVLYFGIHEPKTREIPKNSDERCDFGTATLPWLLRAALLLVR